MGGSKWNFNQQDQFNIEWSSNSRKSYEGEARWGKN